MNRNRGPSYAYILFIVIKMFGSSKTFGGRGFAEDAEFQPASLAV